jgi:serine phosphatase RsbU (regulator of sigma subunit)
VQTVPAAEGIWLYAPVTERGEAVGVLELQLDESPDEQTMAYLAAAAHALAFVVIADRRYTDRYEVAQRSAPVTLEAEIQRRLLPSSYTCEAGRFTLAGWLVPANEAGGDTFDFALDEDTLHVSITDAMGHGVASAQLATLVVGSLRNSRRRGAGIVDQAKAANAALVEHARPDQFVSGQLLRIDLASGAGHLVNAGHLHPRLVRGGAVTEIVLHDDPVFGVLPGAGYRLQHIRLAPGDRLVLLTDGMLDRNAADANVERLLAEIGDLHPREVVQTLTTAVLDVTGGDVRDDATVLVIDWYGGPDVPRNATAGSTDGLASR